MYHPYGIYHTTVGPDTAARFIHVEEAPAPYHGSPGAPVHPTAPVYPPYPFPSYGLVPSPFHVLPSYEPPPPHYGYPWAPVYHHPTESYHRSGSPSRSGGSGSSIHPTGSPPRSGGFVHRIFPVTDDTMTIIQLLNDRYNFWFTDKNGNFYPRGTFEYREIDPIPDRDLRYTFDMNLPECTGQNINNDTHVEGRSFFIPHMFLICIIEPKTYKRVYYKVWKV